MVRNLPAMWETQVWSLGWEDPLEMATHSSILAWRIPWTWGPSGLQSVGLQRGRYNWATNPEGKGTVPLPEAKRNYYLLQVTHTICLMPLHLYDNHIIIYIYTYLLLLFSHQVISDSLRPLGLQGIPVPHHLPEFAQDHVYWISDVIQPSHPLSPSSPSAFNLSQHQSLFQ